MSAFSKVLQTVARAPWSSRAVLRGSLVTAQWVPFRVAKDIDYALEGKWDIDELREALRASFGDVEFSALWHETPWPGWRIFVDGVQVDFGQGDPWAVPPERRVIEGVEVPCVRAEMMLAWKIHGLIEFGPRGQWSPKTLADLVLINRHAPLVRADVVKCLELAFTSRGYQYSALDQFLDDPLWGLSRGSRNKWKSYRKKASWLTLELQDTLVEARDIVRALVR